MLKYLIPFLLYILIWPIIDYFFKNSYLGYFLRTVATAILLIFYFRQYKELKKFKFSFLAILIGILIAVVWVSLEGLYPQIPGEIANPYSLGTDFFIPILITKIIGFILVAPLIEELFVRSFMLRFFINPDFEKVKIGTYSLFSFIITVLFFGFSHNLWLPGLIVGIMLNLFLYKTKSIWSCIQAHMTANLILAVYILLTQSWIFW